MKRAVDRAEALTGVNGFWPFAPAVYPHPAMPLASSPAERDSGRWP